MLSWRELRELGRNLDDQRVLSVYIDAADTAPGVEAWRGVLAGSLRTLRASVADSAHDERAELDRCTALLEARLDSVRDLTPASGWVAFITADGVQHATWLPASVPTQAWWGLGPRVAPYARALAEYRPVLVAIVSTRQGRIYRFERGRLAHVDTVPVEAELRGRVLHHSSGPGGRGQTGAEAAHRSLQENLARMTRSVVERVVREAGDDGWIVIGGGPKATAIAARALPPNVASRAVIAEALPARASTATIRAEAARCAAVLREARDRARVQIVAEAWGADERGTMGLVPTLRALAERSVEELLVSEHFLAHEPENAERVARSALEQGAVIEVVSGEAGSQLDAAAHGIGAKLRFTPAGVVAVA
jgi:hypothetical protein